MTLVDVVGTAIWAMLPAYVPNNAAVLAGGGPPVDGGRTWRGRRLLGDGKTWRGTAVGTAAGIVLALALNAVSTGVATATGFVPPSFPPVAAVSLALGAMVGDLAASFLKRRSGRERGSSLPIVDQLDFAVVALGLTFITARSWFRATFLDPPAVLLVVVLLTPLLHVGTNAGAYLLGLKEEPY